MNINQITESGLLETYAMGLATTDEIKQVELAINQFPALEDELQSIRESLESYALAQAVAPPKHLKNKIMDALAQEAAPVEHIRAIGQKNWWQRLETWQVAAAAILVLSLAGNLGLYQTLQSSNEKLSNLEAQNNTISLGLDSQKASYQALSQELVLTQTPSIKTIVLAGTPDSPRAKARVYWSADKKEVYLSAVNLPDITTNQQYQLWAIVDGKPVDAGVFELGTNMIKLKNINNPRAFAISLEAKGGSTTAVGPKGTIYVMGKV